MSTRRKAERALTDLHCTGRPYFIGKQNFGFTDVDDVIDAFYDMGYVLADPDVDLTIEQGYFVKFEDKRRTPSDVTTIMTYPYLDADDELNFIFFSLNTFNAG